MSWLQSPAALKLGIGGIWGGRDKEIRSSRSSLPTWEVQDSVGLHEIISEGKGGLARGPLSCWTYTVPELLSIPVWPTEVGVVPRN